MTTRYEKEFIIKVGSKGEIFPPKQIREKLGLIHDQPVIVALDGENMVIRKLHSQEHILNRDPKIKISHHALKKMRKKLSEELEDR